MASMRGIEPIVGDWYRSHGQLFEVVAIDEREGVIDLQHADGDLEEIDLDDWATRSRAGSLVAAESPEDLRASTDSEGRRWRRTGHAQLRRPARCARERPR